MNEDEEAIIRYIEPFTLTNDEFHSWGMLRFKNMTKKEFEEQFGKKEEKDE